MFGTDIRTALRDVVRDRRGADIVEFALLGMLIAIVGIAIWGVIAGDLNTGLTNWDSNVQGIWQPPPPQ